MRARLVALAVATFASRGLATPASVFGVGPENRALAGAGSTRALGAASAFVNPAGLAEERAPSLFAGYALTRSALLWQREGAAETRAASPALGTLELGFTLPLRVAEQRFVLGFVSTSPGGSVARIDLPLAETPQFALLQPRARAADFTLSLGVRPWRALSLGVGLRALATLSGNAKVERGKHSSSTVVSDTLDPVIAPLLGASLFIDDETTLSLVLRAPLRADFSMQLGAVDLGATRLPPLNLSGVAHYDPWTLQAELSRRVGPLVGILGGTYQRFGDAPGLVPATLRCPPERVDCKALPAPVAEFHDTVDLHVAAELSRPLTRAARASLRAGYAFLPSPLGEQVGAENLLDNNRMRFGFGYGLQLLAPLPPITLDGFVTLDQLMERTHRKRADVAADNAGAPTLTSRGQLWSAGLGLTVKL